MGTCYRAHDARWSFKPLSGEGASRRGGRFNPPGTPALYLSLAIMTAVKEANHGFAFKIQPCALCCYEVDCEDVADLRTDAGRGEHDLRWENWRWGAPHRVSVFDPSGRLPRNALSWE